MPNILSQMNHTKYQPLYIYPEATIKMTPMFQLSVMHSTACDIIENLSHTTLRSSVFLIN